eukprot:TRINITY_DN4575_c0_g1_i1.p2 TRINITY_DN4575_c0_g1~~TRINITY_DN4575_c0_g1_i1.p2  ORF type:complete len:169 (+),score=28.67 TRINITY_DN4575_c0_g1_i1:209-715(+)
MSDSTVVPPVKRQKIEHNQQIQSSSELVGVQDLQQNQVLETGKKKAIQLQLSQIIPREEQLQQQQCQQQQNGNLFENKRGNLTMNNRVKDEDGEKMMEIDEKNTEQNPQNHVKHKKTRKKKNQDEDFCGSQDNSNQGSEEGQQQQRHKSDFANNANIFNNVNNDIGSQ